MSEDGRDMHTLFLSTYQDNAIDLNNVRRADIGTLRLCSLESGQEVLEDCSNSIHLVAGRCAQEAFMMARVSASRQRQAGESNPNHLHVSGRRFEQSRGQRLCRGQQLRRQLQVTRLTSTLQCLARH